MQVEYPHIQQHPHLCGQQQHEQEQEQLLLLPAPDSNPELSSDSEPQQANSQVKMELPKLTAEPESSDGPDSPSPTSGGAVTAGTPPGSTLAASTTTSASTQAAAPPAKRNHSRGDGYKWRQYGYKRLSCGIVKRLYFFCTARSQTGCTARKLVDRYITTTGGEGEAGSDGEKGEGGSGSPGTTIVEDVVEYKGAHNHPPLPSTSPWPELVAHHMQQHGAPHQHQHAHHGAALQQPQQQQQQPGGQPVMLGYHPHQHMHQHHESPSLTPTNSYGNGSPTLLLHHHHQQQQQQQQQQPMHHQQQGMSSPLSPHVQQPVHHQHQQGMPRQGGPYQHQEQQQPTDSYQGYYNSSPSGSQYGTAPNSMGSYSQQQQGPYMPAGKQQDPLSLMAPSTNDSYSYQQHGAMSTMSQKSDLSLADVTQQQPSMSTSQMSGPGSYRSGVEQGPSYTYPSTQQPQQQQQQQNGNGYGPRPGGQPQVYQPNVPMGAQGQVPKPEFYPLGGPGMQQLRHTQQQPQTPMHQPQQLNGYSPPQSNSYPTTSTQGYGQATPLGNAPSYHSYGTQQPHPQSAPMPPRPAPPQHPNHSGWGSAGNTPLGPSRLSAPPRMSLPQMHQGYTGGAPDQQTSPLSMPAQIPSPVPSPMAGAVSAQSGTPTSTPPASPFGGAYGSTSSMQVEGPRPGLYVPQGSPMGLAPPRQQQQQQEVRVHHTVSAQQQQQQQQQGPLLGTSSSQRMQVPPHMGQPLGATRSLQHTTSMQHSQGGAPQVHQASPLGPPPVPHHQQQQQQQQPRLAAPSVSYSAQPTQHVAAPAAPAASGAGHTVQQPQQYSTVQQQSQQQTVAPGAPAAGTRPTTSSSASRPSTSEQSETTTPNKGGIPSKDGTTTAGVLVAPVVASAPGSVALPSDTQAANGVAPSGVAVPPPAGTWAHPLCASRCSSTTHVIGGPRGVQSSPQSPLQVMAAEQSPAAIGDNKVGDHSTNGKVGMPSPGAAAGTMPAGSPMPGGAPMQQVRWEVDEGENSPTSATSPTSPLLPDLPTNIGMPQLTWKVEEDMLHRQQQHQELTDSQGSEGRRFKKQRIGEHGNEVGKAEHQHQHHHGAIMMGGGELSPITGPSAGGVTPRSGVSTPASPNDVGADSLLSSWLTEHTEEGQQGAGAVVTPRAALGLHEDHFFSNLIDYLANE